MMPRRARWKARAGTLRALGAALPLALALAAVPARAQEAAPATRTTLDSVFTAEQAERGRKVYQKVCGECHARDEYTGEMMDGWVGAPLYDLFDLLLTSMPEDNPGSLSRREYTDVIAYILQLNDMPAGAERLSSRASELRRIIFTRRDES